MRGEGRGERRERKREREKKEKKERERERKREKERERERGILTLEPSGDICKRRARINIKNKNYSMCFSII